MNWWHCQTPEGESVEQKLCLDQPPKHILDKYLILNSKQHQGCDFPSKLFWCSSTHLEGTREYTASSSSHWFCSDFCRVTTEILTKEWIEYSQYLSQWSTSYWNKTKHYGPQKENQSVFSLQDILLKQTTRLSQNCKAVKWATGIREELSELQQKYTANV